MPQHHTMLAVGLVILGLVSPHAASATAHDQPARPEAITHRGMLIANPDAISSPAALDPSTLADKAGRTPPPSFDAVAHAAVVAFIAPGHTTDDLIARAPFATTPEFIPGLPGVLRYRCASVAHAVALIGSLHADPAIAHAELDIEHPRALRGVPGDPSLGLQWFLINNTSPQIDLNVAPVWDAGITGAGVTIGIVEGGWQTDHPDIASNFSPNASMPGGSAVSHATSCAGLIAAAGDNGIGGAGVAFGASLSNLIYGGPASATAEALAFRNDLNDIKSNSWGPPDNGLFASISSVEREAISQGTTTGRGGLGTIYVWSAGNGGAEDRVDYDPYASSRHTIAVGAIGDQGTRADYNESGSSMFVVAPSSGNIRDVYTTANQSGYDPEFGGTSAAAPLVAGVVALMLEANPSLTVRDVQHILARTADRCDPTDPAWSVNAGGRSINPNFGFGLVNAHAAVDTARSWQPVAPMITADSGTLVFDLAIPDNTPSGVTRAITIDQSVRVEHAELILDVTTTYVGDLSIVLSSPGGTTSVLAQPRDDPQDNLNQRVLTSVRHWDEPGRGVWTVTLADHGPFDLAQWNSARLILYGTPLEPGCSPADLAEPYGQINFFDIVEYLARYGSLDPSADLDDDGLWTFFDIAAYLASYNQGCP